MGSGASSRPNSARSNTDPEALERGDQVDAKYKIQISCSVSGESFELAEIPAKTCIEDVKRSLSTRASCSMYCVGLMCGTDVLSNTTLLCQLPRERNTVALSMSRTQPSYEASVELLQMASLGIDAVEPILWKSADPNIAEPSTGETPLSQACRVGHLAVVQLLFKAGAQKNQGTSDGSTPLFIASEKGQPDVVRFLCELVRTRIKQPSTALLRYLLLLIWDIARWFAFSVGLEGKSTRQRAMA